MPKTQEELDEARIARLEKRSFKEIQLVKGQTRHSTFAASDSGDCRFHIKIADDHIIESEQLRNENNANRFLQKMTEGITSIRIPGTRWIEDDQGSFLFAEWIDGTPVETTGGARLTQMELEALAEMVERLHGLSESNIPAYFRTRATSEFRDEYYTGRLRKTYLTPAVQSHVLSASQAEELQSSFEKHMPLSRVFAHHDITTSNLIRGKDGTLWLVDAEFARHEMAGWDIAYFFLQERILLDHPITAAEGFTLFLDQARLARPELVDEIWAPLTYWLGAEAFTVIKHPERIELVQRFITPILERDLLGLLSI